MATVVDCQRALEMAVVDLVDAMNVLIAITPSLTLSVPRGEYALNFQFDDSLIVDSEARMMQDRQAVTMGIMPKYLFLVRNYGLDETTARKWIGEVQAEQPQEPAFGAE